MNPLILLQGALLGFSIAAPIGPVGILCIQRTLLRGRRSGLISGLGAASADMVYASIAVFGFTLLFDLLIGHQSWLRLFGGAFLLYLGTKTILSKPHDQANAAEKTNLKKEFASTFAVTITNPLTLLSFAAIFTVVAGTSVSDSGNAVFFVAGVFLGSMLWWTLLSIAVGAFRRKINARRIKTVNTISGLVIITFAAYFLLSVLLAF